MQLYPALDIINGGVVRLQQGDFQRTTEYDLDPLKQAQSYARQGATWLHLVDLDGARQGSPVNQAILQEISEETSLKIQCGGGIRSEDDLQCLLSAGASRVVIGSLAFKRPHEIRCWMRKYGPEKICIAMDVRLNDSGIPHIATEAWRSVEQLTLWQAIDSFADSGLVHILCTDIGRDGELSGPNSELYAQIHNYDRRYLVQASGGISTLSDLSHLSAAGAAGAITGKALLEGKFNVAEALAEGCI